ncbi:MAG: hypothetical protein ACE5H3_12605 [Planctomycetota bacterium]
MTQPLFFLVALLSAVLPTAPRIPTGDHPASEEAFAKAVGLRKVSLFRAPGLEFWCQDPALLKKLEKPVLQAWELSGSWFGKLETPGDIPTRVVLLSSEKALRAYAGLAAAEAQRLGVPAPGPAFFDGAVHSGSGLWTLPPLLLLDSRVLKGNLLLTRLIHDLSVSRAGFALNPRGVAPPPFFAEGLAGMLVRRVVKKPAALVSHEQAAVSSQIHGYGVFAGIGSKLNDNSNHPGNWPGVVRQGVKAMRKKKEIDPQARIDALFLRGPGGFARSDYALAWAALEFLLGPERRPAVLQVLQDLRASKENLDAGHLARRFHDSLLKRLSATPEELQAAFLDWVENEMPRR